MLRFRSFVYHLGVRIHTLMAVLLDAMCFLVLGLRPAPALAAENLFLRKQLAQYQERQIKPRRANDATRVALVWLSWLFDWRRALVIVQPATLIRWHRQGFRWFWRWRSKPGRSALPKDLQALIRRMALENPTWGPERIANELLLKLGLKASPRTVRKYMPAHCVGSPGKRGQSQRWSTFVRNHVRTPVANSICERVIGTLRRECLDLVIPLNETPLYSILKELVGHYNQGRPHMSLGPGIPLPIRTLPVSQQAHRHRMPTGQYIVARPVIGGLHHDYGLEKQAT
jgi:hypothetical protein